MTERELLRRFTKHVKELDDVYWKKLPDSFGGHKQPFDAFAFYKSVGFAFEAKMKGKKLSPHQLKELTDANMKGCALTFVIITEDKKLTFIPLVDGQYFEYFSVELFWHRSQFVNLEYLFQVLLMAYAEAVKFRMQSELENPENVN